MLRRCLPFVIVASSGLFPAAPPGRFPPSFNSARPTATRRPPQRASPPAGYTVLQGPLDTTSPTLFYHTFLYPGASDGTMTDITSQFTGVARIGSTNMNGSGQFIACQTSPVSGTTATGGWIYSGGTATSLCRLSELQRDLRCRRSTTTATQAGYYTASSAICDMSPYRLHAAGRTMD